MCVCVWNSQSALDHRGNYGPFTHSELGVYGLLCVVQYNVGRVPTRNILTTNIYYFIYLRYSRSLCSEEGTVNQFDSQATIEPGRISKSLRRQY